MLLTTRILGMFVLFLILSGFIPFPQEIASADTVSTKVSNLNVRSGPGLNFEVIGQIKQGKEYNIISEEESWVQIDLGGKTGWVANWLVNRNASDIKQNERGIEVIQSKVEILNVRSGPSTGFPVIEKISPGKEYPLLEKKGDWSKIQLPDNKTGWVANWLVHISKRSEKLDSSFKTGNNAVIQAEVLNVRSGPSTSYEKIGQITKGSEIEILEVKEGWFKFSFNGKEGWIAGEFAKQYDQGEETIENTSDTNQTGENQGLLVEVNSATLNLRSDPSLESDILTQLNQGTQAILLKKDGDWSKIKLSDGTTGWVASWLIKEVHTQISNQPTVKILNPGTNLRAGPSTKHEIVAKADEGEIFPIINTVNDWFQIQLKNGQTAYVAGWIVSAHGVPGITKPNLTNSLNGKVIVVDAGHGGKDQGAEGVGKKTKEKTLNLEVAEILAAKLEAAGAKVIMTRTDDSYITLERRVAIAVKATADAFISIHHNTYKNSSMNGTITFYYSKSKDMKLAELIQSELTKRNGLRDLGVRFGNYYVLRENPRTSVLVELGFLTNAKEELVLRSDRFQENSAEGIFQGILKYFQ